MAFVGMGIGADMTLIGKDVILLVLGPGWATAGRIFKFFGPGVGIMLIYNTHGWLHLSIGTAHRWFRWVVVEFAVTFLLFLVGIHWGPEGIAGAWTLSFWILTIPAFWYAGKEFYSSCSSGWRRIGHDPEERSCFRRRHRSAWGFGSHGCRFSLVRSFVSDCGCSPPRRDGSPLAVPRTAARYVAMA